MQCVSDATILAQIRDEEEAPTKVKTPETPQRNAGQELADMRLALSNSLQNLINSGISTRGVNNMHVRT